ncbi:MAG: restriction endonuclease [Proteobacteria bacterium]|nr:restriction endonuclease [Pseudomonadota bacterium]
MNQGSLFTQDYLLRGIVEDKVWTGLPATEFDAFRTKCKAIFADFNARGKYNETQTEDDLIYPLLAALDWPRECWLAQARTDTKGRANVPDLLLFPDSERKTQATKAKSDSAKYRHGIAIVENKAWGIQLDREPKGKGARDEVPSTQILRYLNVADVQSDRHVLWGILTNGRHWRLYWQQARSRAEDFLEIDLPVLLGVDGVEPELFSPPPERRDHWLKVFYLMFRRAAFLPGAEKRSFHEAALAEGRRWESQVAKNLSELVFGRVYRELVRGLAAGDPAAKVAAAPGYFEELRQASLILLYRLLFVLYAEDRNLLPVRSPKYDDYALLRMREDIARQIDEDQTFSARQSRYYNNLKDLFRAIDKGDPALEVPPYNGGLFDPAHAPLLERATVSDAIFAPVLDALSRVDIGGRRLMINYRDLTVQQLGSIYERLLEYDVALRDDAIEVVPNAFARKGSGSYYTPDELVGLIIDRTVGPQIEERRQAFAAAAEKLRTDRRPKAAKLLELAELDPAMRILDLKICDPAMGSGHFLVSLVDYLADRVLQAMTDARAAVTWADDDAPYVSPLGAALAKIRTQIRKHATEGGWTVSEAQLEDRLLVRRMILKRCVYGVDRNPMAVELAKVALWLHTFTVGAPLSFLDHHLRCGNSLFGELVRPVEDELSKRGAMFLLHPLRRAKESALSMTAIERLTDADLAEVKTSAATFAEVEERTGPLAAFLSFVHALRWFDRKDATTKKAVDAFYEGSFGDPIHIAAGTEAPRPPAEKKQDEFIQLKRPEQQKLLKKEPTTNVEIFQAFTKLLADIRALVAEERFLHWQVAFPGVWDKWESNSPDGGFDAVIGNPPWDRMKLQEVEWFAVRRPEIAHAQRASDRKKMIAALEKSGDPLWLDYEKAGERADAAARVARSSGRFPLLSGGDTNLYSLFVEQGIGLLHPKGISGLLTPSGIASDKSASEFFRSISTAGRLGALLDFENRRPHDEPFFPDVDSRFKFVAMVCGAARRRFELAKCGFYLSSIADLQDPERCFELRPADFNVVNPNTGTAPVFRTRRDALLTTAIYSRVPVLIDRSGEEAISLIPVEYSRMLDMTNDSKLFKTARELEKSGWYAIDGGRFKKGALESAQLLVGRSVHQFDHRFASIDVNEENLHNQAQSGRSTDAEKADPTFSPKSQFFVDVREIKWAPGFEWGIAFRDIARATDVRTVISALIPRSPCGNKLPLIQPRIPKESTAIEIQNISDRYRRAAPLLCANLNSLPLDFVARQKLHSTSLNWYIVEQLPIIPEDEYATKFGKRSARDLVREEVLKLTYVSHDMKPFADDMGYSGKPFAWDPDARRHSRARLDAIYFHLYGLKEDEMDYILDTFPIVQREDEAAFGRYMTKDLVVGYFRAFAAGDTSSKIAV